MAHPCLNGIKSDVTNGAVKHGGVGGPRHCCRPCVLRPLLSYQKLSVAQPTISAEPLPSTHKHILRIGL